MIGTEYFLALVLLTSPEPTSAHDPKGLTSSFAALKGPLLQWALVLEIVDQRETRYIFAAADQFVEDLRIVRGRYAKLRNTPRLEDIKRYPSRNTINEFIAFNRNYKQYLEEQMNIYGPREDLRTAKKETDHLYHVWDSLRDARCEYYYVHIRRESIRRLIELVGEDEYFAGNIPPHIPTWRFEIIP